MNASASNLPLRRQTNSSGFTLIELMVTIAVLAIIVGIAAPSIGSQLANQRVKSTAATIENALKEARAESLIRRQNITVVYDATGTPKSITLQANNTNISSYNISASSTVAQSITPSSISSVIFQPNKTLADGATVEYTICDSGFSGEKNRHVSVNKISNVKVKSTGDCS